MAAQATHPFHTAQTPSQAQSQSPAQSQSTPNSAHTLEIENPNLNPNPNSNLKSLSCSWSWSRSANVVRSIKHKTCLPHEEGAAVRGRGGEVPLATTLLSQRRRSGCTTNKTSQPYNSASTMPRRCACRPQNRNTRVALFSQRKE